MTQYALDQFGKHLIQDVRDRAIEDLDKTLAGEMKGRSAARIMQIIESETNCLDLIKRLVPYYVDLTIHKVLAALEEAPVSITYHLPSGESVNIKAATDGLSGELYSEDGWIARFSSFRYSFLE